METRVGPGDVLALMPGTGLDDGGVTPFLEDASTWVTNYLADGKCRGLASDKLPVIEKYLAAHLATITTEGGELVQATRGDVSERYAEMGRGQTTHYIAAAAAFEPCGIVAEHWMDGRRAKWRVGAGYASGGGP